MEITAESIIGILGMLFGGGALGGICTWRWQRRKAKAEAKTAEVDAAKELQDVYQQLIADIKTDRDEQKAYINELKEDRRHLREERNELRDRQDKLEETVRGLQREVARNGRMVELMRPLLCGREGCIQRVPVTVSPSGEIEKTIRPQQKHAVPPGICTADIEPYNED